MELRHCVHVFAVLGLVALRSVWTAEEDIIDEQIAGLKMVLPETELNNLAASITPTVIASAISQGEAAAQALQDSLATAPTEPAFGTQLATNPNVLGVAFRGDKFLAGADAIKTQLNLNTDDAKLMRGVDLSSMSTSFDCPYDDPITCDPAAKYRTIDGSCNNLVHPIWGRAVTPLERFLPPDYQNGICGMRTHGSYTGNPLPNARDISTKYHQASTPSHRQGWVTHMTMLFGQFVSHDVVFNSVSRTPYGDRLQCCTGGFPTTNQFLIALGCQPIPVAANDPYFGNFGGKRCLNFVRALTGPNLDCEVGTCEQINQVTHFLDGSVIYGSDDVTANSIRLGTGGLLKTSPHPHGGKDLLPQDPGNPGCFNAVQSEFCFKAGDVRANQNPPLLSVHTIFVREHNRVAAILANNHAWDDNKLYQEARRIVIAEFQHVTYNEYLQLLISPFWAGVFKLTPHTSGYNTEYRTTTMPAIRNEFMTVGFRSGHSTVDSIFRPGFFFKDHFLDPHTLYDPSIGINGVVSSLVSAPQQKMDRFKTDQLTNHLFEFGIPGNGGDLAATNIMRGRDHGTPSYDALRQACHLPRANSWFNYLWSFGLGNIGILQSLYGSGNNAARDVEAWTAVSSEKLLPNAVFGPTAMCITGAQFYYLKNGDRFFYENDNPTVKFTLRICPMVMNMSILGNSDYPIVGKYTYPRVQRTIGNFRQSVVFDHKVLEGRKLKSPRR